MQVPLGDFGVQVEVGDRQVVGSRRAPAAPNVPDLAAALRAALEQPRNFPPLRRALTPDDRIAVVVDERLPQLGRLLGRLVEYLTEAGIDPAAITLVSAAGSRQAWVDDLPDIAQDVRTEIHNPADRKAVSYLASTRAGRRVYLNRTVVEADQSIVLAGCRYDPAVGLHDATRSLFPALSDADTLRELAGARPQPLRDEANEVAWLLGVPFLAHLIEGSGEGAAHVVGGTVESIPECERLLAERWQVRCAGKAQTVVATMTGDPARHDFEALAQAASSAAGVVQPGGRIVLLTRAHPQLGEAAELLRDTDSAEVAARRVQERRPADHAAALRWLEAARHASIYLLSGLADETVEELFATPLQQARQAQRLLDVAGSCLIVEDAHRALAVVE